MLPDRLTQPLFDGQLRWRMWRHGMTHREAHAIVHISSCQFAAHFLESCLLIDYSVDSWNAVNLS
jgi:hypothetical protein